MEPITAWSFDLYCRSIQLACSPMGDSLYHYSQNECIRHHSCCCLCTLRTDTIDSFSLTHTGHPCIRGYKRLVCTNLASRSPEYVQPSQHCSWNTLPSANGPTSSSGRNIGPGYTPALSPWA